jgi:hypothetical protein
MGVNRELRDAYRATWEIFSSRLDELQAWVEAGGHGAEAALLAVEKARIAHNAARDRLAEQLLGQIAAVDKRAMGAAEQRRVRDTAHLLWEIAGKPNGSADSDWHRAEVLVRSASASSAV